jgi:hypothetical protein
MELKKGSIDEVLKLDPKENGIQRGNKSEGQQRGKQQSEQDGYGHRLE